MKPAEKNKELKEEKEELSKLAESLHGIDDRLSLVEFLKDKGSGHTRFFHYTNLESLTCILESRHFRMASGVSRQVNDQLEDRLAGTPASRSCIYTGSFGYGAMERVAMWGLYGLPREMAVRILIPAEAMKEWVSYLNSENQTLDILSEEEHNLTPVLRARKTFELTDLLYVRTMNEVNGIVAMNFPRPFFTLRWMGSHYGHELQEYDNICDIFRGNVTGTRNQPLRDECYAGRVKHQWWEYEQEVRLLMKLKLEKGDKKCDLPTSVDLPIPANVLKSMFFRWGPNVKRMQVRLIEKEIERILGPVHQVKKSRGEYYESRLTKRFYPSALNGKIKYRCDDISNIGLRNLFLGKSMEMLRRQVIGAKLDEILNRLREIAPLWV